MLNTLFTYYLESRGWLVFAILPSIIFLIMLIDNQRNQRGAIGWLAGVFICFLLFIPAMIYDLGPTETREALTDVRLLLFYIGILGLILPVMLGAGYWVSYRTGTSVSSPISSMPPPAPSSSMNTLENEAATMMEDDYSVPPHRVPPPSPYGSITDDEKPTEINSAGPAPIAASNARLLNAWLIDESNPNNRYQLREGRTQIGRGQHHDINLTNDTISRNGHAAITYANGQFIVHDLGATAGVKLNGYHINGTAELHHDSIITLGEVSFKFISS